MDGILDNRWFLLLLLMNRSMGIDDIYLFHPLHESDNHNALAVDRRRVV